MNNLNYISNSSPLIAFLKKKEFNLLKLLFDTIIIPEAVYTELRESEKHQDQIKILEDAIEEGWIIVKKVKKLYLSDLNLGEGEKQAVNLCLHYKNSILLIDEKKGSSIAKAYDVRTLGTLGILLLAKKRGAKTKEELLENIDMLIKTNFYLSSDVITSFIKDIQE